MMRVVLAVTGGRDLTLDDWTAGLAKLEERIDAPPGDAVIHLFHGDAFGWDAAAKAWAESCGIPHTPIPYAAGEVPGVPRAAWGKRRNHTIMRKAREMARVEVCDSFCLAGWNGMSGGTAHGIAAAVAHGFGDRIVLHGVRR